MARLLKERGVERVFALCGGHIMPIWMRLDAHGIRIIDVRDERAAVHMAQAHAEVTGELGVALVTAGPGVTNAMTGIANAHVSRAPVLVIAGRQPASAGKPRRPARSGPHTPRAHDHALCPNRARASSRVAGTRRGHLAGIRGGRRAGPGLYRLSRSIPCAAPCRSRSSWRSICGRKRGPLRGLTAARIAEAVDLLWSARRVLVISGRGARGAGPELVALLDRLGAVYLDTGESRGLVPDTHPSVVGAMRGAVMGDADVVLTVGRRLDFQLAYGSPAIFGSAQFVRIADIPCGAAGQSPRRCRDPRLSG